MSEASLYIFKQSFKLCTSNDGKKCRRASGQKRLNCSWLCSFLVHLRSWTSARWSSCSWIQGKFLHASQWKQNSWRPGMVQCRYSSQKCWNRSRSIALRLCVACLESPRLRSAWVSAKIHRLHMVSMSSVSASLGAYSLPFCCSSFVSEWSEPSSIPYSVVLLVPGY